jgi:hypothetical protein
MLESSKLIGAELTEMMSEKIQGLSLEAFQIIYIFILAVVILATAPLLAVTGYHLYGQIKDGNRTAAITGYQAVGGNEDVVYTSQEAIHTQIVSDSITNPGKFKLSFKINTQMAINENRQIPYPLNEVPKELPVALTGEEHNILKALILYNATLRLTHEIKGSDGIIYNRPTGNKACANFDLLKAVYIHERSQP